jgi:hypothetical protein
VPAVAVFGSGEKRLTLLEVAPHPLIKSNRYYDLPCESGGIIGKARKSVNEKYPDSERYFVNAR